MENLRPMPNARANSGYELTLPNGATENFKTLGDVLHRMNQKPVAGAESLYGKADRMEVCTPGGKIYFVEQRYSQLGILMPPGQGQVQDIMNRMFDEVMPYAQGELGTIKAPWQMTAAQWGAINAIGSVAYGVYPCLSGEHHKQSCTTREGNQRDVVGYVNSEFNARFGYGHNGPLYDGQQTNSRHEIHVAYALARGDTVPEHVLAEYQDEEKVNAFSGLHWFSTLLKKPYLRGRISADRLSQLVTLLNSDRPHVHEITVENAPFFIGLMNSLPAEATSVDFDNLLYEKGVLHVRPMPVPAQEPNIGVPVNAFATELRKMQVEKRKRTQSKHIEEQMAKRNMTLREMHFQLKLVEGIDTWETHTWANRVAQAVESKNLVVLLDVLDGPSNDTTKRAIEKFYPVKLLNVSAAKRRRAVFALAGHVTDEHYAVAEAAYKAERKATAEAQEAEKERKRNETRLEDTRAVATGTNYRVNGVAMNGAEFVEKIIREGYTQLDARKRGAVAQSILRNPQTSSFYKLKRKDGTLDYAEVLLEKETAAA